MAHFKPCPQETLLSVENLRYTLRHSRDLFVPNVTKCDGAHIHSCCEVYVHVEGTGFFLVNNRIFQLEKGCVVFTRQNDVHVRVLSQACRFEHYCLWIDGLEEILFTGPSASEFQSFIQFRFQERELLLELLNTLEDRNRTELEKTAAFFAILAMIESAKRDSAISFPAEIPLPMQKILSYMNASFSDIQHVQEICDRFYISPATLNRWFRQYTGLSPRIFLESKKLAYAKQFLENGASVTDAALHAGFFDCSYFIRVFKRKFGITPKQYQKKNSNTHSTTETIPPI